jgi:hypothetical protein
MEEITWSDGLGSRSRSPFLLLIKGDEIVAFEGKDMPGIIVVKGSDYSKNGKWSHSTYRLQLAKGVRTIAGMSGWETGRFVEGLGRAVNCSTPDTWADTAGALGVSVLSTMEFLRSWRPKAAEKLDEVERSLATLEELSAQETDSEMVTVSFGSPNNQAISDGYWESPKVIPGHEAEIRLIDSDKGWAEGNIEVVGISGTVLSVTHSPGMHGGYYAVSVAIIPGTETEISPFQTAREKAAEESGLPEALYHAFNGDEDKVREFMAKVEKLDARRLDEHEMSCGRARKEAEVIKISGDKDFFLGTDPLKVCWYIEEVHGSATSSFLEPELVETKEIPKNSAFAAALKKAGLK